jgi:hypothetical protein
LAAAAEEVHVMAEVRQSGKLLAVEDQPFDFKVARMISSLQQAAAAEVMAAQVVQVVVTQVQAVL